MNTYFIYKTDGFFQSQEEADAFTKKYGNPFGHKFKTGALRYVDADGNGTLDGNDRVYEDSLILVYTFGLNLNADHKGFDLSLMFNGDADVYRMFSGEVYGRLERMVGTVDMAGTDPETRATINPNASAEDKLIEERVFKPHMRYLPMSQTAIDKNPKLKPTPGY